MGKATLVLALGLVAAAQSAPLAVLPLLMEALALGADQLGLAVAAGLLATLLLAPRAGRLADRVSPAWMARAGLAILCAASVLLCAATALALGGALPAGAAFAAVLATRLANGVGVALLHPAAQAWLWAGAGDEAGAALQGRAGAAQNAGRFLGPVGVALVAGLGAAWTLAAMAGVSAVAGLLLLLIPGPARRTTPTARHRGGTAQAPLPGRVKVVLAALLALHLLGGGAQFLLGPLLLERFGLGAAEAARWAGGLMALAAVASIAGNLLGRALPQHRRALIGAGATVAGAVGLAPFADLGLIAAGVATVALGIGVAVPAAMAELMRHAPESRGRVAGWASATQAAGYAVAAPVYGVVFSVNPMLAAALLPVPATACLILFAACAPRNSKGGSTLGPPPGADRVQMESSERAKMP